MLDWLCLADSPLDPYPYKDWGDHIRTDHTLLKLLEMERETIVLLENRNNTLPLSQSIQSIALIGPSANQTIVSTHLLAPTTQRLTDSRSLGKHSSHPSLSVQ